MPSYPLNESAQVTIAASGTGETFVAPPATERWDIDRMSVVTNQGDTTPPFPVCAVYLDSVSDSNIFDKTYSGHMDTSDCNIHLEKGQRLVARWTGGVAGSRATLSVFGTRTTY